MQKKDHRFTKEADIDSDPELKKKKTKQTKNKWLIDLQTNCKSKYMQTLQLFLSVNVKPFVLHATGS